MATQSKIMSVKAVPGRWNPKKSNDQIRFKNNCRKKKNKAFRLPEELDDQSNAKDIPISAYNMVHTIGKTIFGGVPAGKIK